MKQRKNGAIYHSGDYSGKKPDWYWVHGLHDALIKSVEKLPFDYTLEKSAGKSLKLYIDSIGALYDNTIKSISLINYKIMTTDIELNNVHWLEDVLTFENEKYVLNITVTDCKENYVFTVKFDKAIVERSNDKHTK